MTGISPWTLFVAWIVIGLAVFWLAPRLPAWLGFAAPLVVAVYGVVELVRDGPQASEVALTLVSAALAAAVWWRDLRGTECPSRTPRRR